MSDEPQEPTTAPDLPQPGEVVEPTGDTLHGATGPVESMHQHEVAEEQTNQEQK